MTKLRLVNPCEKSWSDLEERGSGRYCAACHRTVYDAESMTSGELDALLARERSPCLRAALLADGTPLTRDRLRAPGPARAALVASALAAALACDPTSKTPGGSSPVTSPIAEAAGRAAGREASNAADRAIAARQQQEAFQREQLEALGGYIVSNQKDEPAGSNLPKSEGIAPKPASAAHPPDGRCSRAAKQLDKQDRP